MEHVKDVLQCVRKTRGQPCLGSAVPSCCPGTGCPSGVLPVPQHCTPAVPDGVHLTASCSPLFLGLVSHLELFLSCVLPLQGAPAASSMGSIQHPWDRLGRQLPAPCLSVPPLLSGTSGRSCWFELHLCQDRCVSVPSLSS